MLDAVGAGADGKVQDPTPDPPGFFSRLCGCFGSSNVDANDDFVGVTNLGGAMTYLTKGVGDGTFFGTRTEFQALVLAPPAGRPDPLAFSFSLPKLPQLLTGILFLLLIAAHECLRRMAFCATGSQAADGEESADGRRFGEGDRCAHIV